MAVPFHTQLQPFEENQSPSPTEERENPYELALHRSRSPHSYSKSPKRSPSLASNHAGTSPTRGPPSPNDTVNTLQRQLSGDPENPPPPWQRRPSVSTQRSRTSSVNSHTRSARSPSDPSSTSPPLVPSQPPSASRRHPNLKMTASSMRPPLPNAMFLHESPSGSSSSLVDDPTLTLPQPAFRRRKGGRSSIHSSQDLSSLTSEELWSLEQETGVSGNSAADMSNPMTRSQERPLDTVRRMSSRIEHSPYRTGLPQDVIWPTAPPEDLYNPPVKSRSVTSMVSLRNGNKQKRMSRNGSRQPSIDMTAVPGRFVDGVPYNKSTPVSPQDAVLISSNNSSSTSLASHNLPPNKSNLSLGSRPPSSFQSQLYQSRDILSALAPREGGYAIAAQMGNGLGAVGTMSVEERRRSAAYEGERPRSMARAPMSRSSGMGRWSLDGGEHYGKPYGTPSNATTSTSISGRTHSSHEVSPPADDESSKSSYLPDGASPPAGPRSAVIDSPIPPSLPVNSTPVNPSPLSQNTAAGDLPSPAPLQQANAYPLSSPTPEAIAAAAATSTPPAPPPVAPVTIPTGAVAAPAPSPLNTKKSKKDLAKDAKVAAKEAKAAEKAAAAKAALQRAKEARDAAAKKQADKDAAKKKKEDDKRKAKEEKAQLKAEKKAGLKTKLKNSSVVGFQRSTSTTPSATGVTSPAADIPPVPAIPAQHKAQDAAQAEFGAKSGSVPFPATHNPQAAQLPKAALDKPRPTATSLPLGVMAPTTVPAASAAPVRPVGPAQTVSQGRGSTKSRMGMFGTLKKRLSFFGDDKTTLNSPTARGPPVKANEALPPVPPTPPKYAQQMGTPRPATPVVIEPEAAPASVATPPGPTAGSVTSPEPLADLPPRSSSRPDSMLLATSSMTTPQPFPSTEASTPTGPRMERSDSHTPTSPIASPSLTHSSPLTKTLSHGDHAIRTGSPTSVRKGGSIRGPRPMPRTSPSPEKARPASISTSELQPQLAAAGSSSAVDASAITPSTSGESTENGDGSLFSHTISKDSSGGTDIASPFTSVGGNGDSEKGSFNTMGDERDVPEREGSNETVTIGEKAAEGVPLAASIPVSAH